MARNKIGVGADGSHNAFARKGEPALAVHHDPNEAREDDHGIAPRFMKPAAKKVMHPVSIHKNMTRQQIDAAGLGGMGHATAVISGGQKLATDAPAAPLQHAYGNVLKTRPAAQVVPGMRSRTSQHDPAIGAAILASAVCNK